MRARSGVRRGIPNVSRGWRGETRRRVIFIGILRDISEIKATELGSRESELHMRLVLDTVADGIVAIDECGVIQSFSSAAERLFGYPSREVIGRNATMLMPSPRKETHDA